MLARCVKADCAASAGQRRNQGAKACPLGGVDQQIWLQCLDMADNLMDLPHGEHRRGIDVRQQGQCLCIAP